MNLLKENTGLLIRFDDIAPNMNWELMDKCEKFFLEYDIKPVVGVIANNEDKDLLKFPYKKDFWEKVRKWQNYRWEVAMHGYNHLYDVDTKKKDFFGYGGKSEFFGHSLDDQVEKVKNSIKIFKENNINIRCFFAPNHTYDLNTFEALKISGIDQVIDGYGLLPYCKYGIKFIPQLFYRNIFLPFGIQSTQIHLNDWTMEDYKKFKVFIEKNRKKIISYDYALSKVSSGKIHSVINNGVKLVLKSLRSFNFRG